MEHPVYWSALLAATLLAVVLRLRAGRPLLARRAAVLRRTDLAVAAVAAAALGFHCGAMFFAPWVDAVPGTLAAAEAVRALGTASQVAYWVPAVALLVAWRRVWWPGLAALAVALAGVGLTMFRPYPLATHLAWIAAAILLGVLVAAALVRPAPAGRAATAPA